MLDDSASATAADILSQPPFVKVQGVINIRHIGGYATSVPSTVTKSGVIFRSGELSRVTDKGKEQLAALGVKCVFDLRAPIEVAQYATATPEIDGVTIIAAPASLEGFDPVALVNRLKGFHTDPLQTFVNLYDEIMTVGAASFNTIFRHIVDKPDEPCLIHCTAGKDRTGVFFALLLMVLGVSDEDIAKDYSLTTAGLAPAMPMMIERFKKQAVYASNPEGALSMGSSRPESMIATLKMIREKYGGAEDYLKTHTSLKDDDFIKLREMFVTSL